MELATVDGLELAYELVGSGGEPWVITPGGRYPMDSGGVHELAEALVRGGRQVLLWDRPNVGGSSVCFAGPSESVIQADALAGLLRQLDLAPAVLAGGSGGSRVSLLTASRHPDVARGVAVWWISGGVYGLLTIGTYYCASSIQAAWNGGMEAVLELPDWQMSLERNPGNRERFLALDPKGFIATLEQWLAAYCPCAEELMPGLSLADAEALDVPTLVFRSGESDMHHTRAMSEQVAAVLPHATLVEPPWGDTEWVERQQVPSNQRFGRWPLLAPQLLEWADRTLG